ncbi:MAG: aldo/keto reductase, partial [Clostridia bacterium]|nr:aldo/keto reductase [Clostridia bacterium]
MEYKRLKNTDLTVSTIALGTDVYGTDLDEKTSFEMLNFYVQNGGNIIDTANVYADWAPGERGRSEKLIGRWLKNIYPYVSRRNNTAIDKHRNIFTSFRNIS